MSTDDRIYQDDDGQWFFRVRGHHGIGPFSTRELAEEALARQIRSWTGQNLPKLRWPRALQPGRRLRRSASRQN